MAKPPKVLETVEDDVVVIDAEVAVTEAEPAPKADAPDAKAAEVPAKLKEKAPKADAPAADVPYPTQADLDAMRSGTYGNRELKSR